MIRAGMQNEPNIEPIQEAESFRGFSLNESSLKIEN
jgi:hypothetical protein